MTDHLPVSRLLLLPDPRPPLVDRSGVPVKRYRLARVARDPRSDERHLPFEYLKRTYD